MQDDLVGNSLLQSLIDASAQNAGISSITLPSLLGIAPQQDAAPTPRLPTKPKTSTPKNAFGKVLATPNPKIIGTPYHGTHTLGTWESDNAVDIAMPAGTPIRAPYDGVIGSQIGSLGSSNPRMQGLRVHLAGKGQELYFAHLSRLAVKAGQRVKAGQIIGYSGSANGVQHLHLGVRKGNPGVYA
jgi:murein DD-endopeptidase MepM/ murein hydrolase activator NlpD